MILLIHIKKDADNEDDWDKSQEQKLEQESCIDGIPKRMCFHNVPPQAVMPDN